MAVSNVPDAEELQAPLKDRHGLTEEQAACVASAVAAAYNDEALVLLYEGGIERIPETYWGEYGYAVLECTLMGDVPGSP